MSAPQHPAPFHPEVLRIATEELVAIIPARRRDLRVLDPFAGEGNIHDLQGRIEVNGRHVHTVAVELMAKWAAVAGTRGESYCASATALNFHDATFDAVVTSPCYGNRMADHHDAGDVCKQCGGSGEVKPPGSAPGSRPRCSACKGTGLSHRRSYRHYYGDDFWTDAPRELNAGAMAWGDDYRALHAAAWREVERVLRPGGLFLLNIKDHVKDGRRVHVSAWHRRTVLELGLVELGRWDIPTSGFAFGAHREVRVPNEHVYVFTKQRSKR